MVSEGHVKCIVGSVLWSTQLSEKSKCVFLVDDINKRPLKAFPVSSDTLGWGWGGGVDASCMHEQ